MNALKGPITGLTADELREAAKGTDWRAEYEEACRKVQFGMHNVPPFVPESLVRPMLKWAEDLATTPHPTRARVCPDILAADSRTCRACLVAPGGLCEEHLRVVEDIEAALKPPVHRVVVPHEPDGEPVPTIGDVVFVWLGTYTRQITWAFFAVITAGVAYGWGAAIWAGIKALAGVVR